MLGTSGFSVGDSMLPMERWVGGGHSIGSRARVQASEDASKDGFNGRMFLVRLTQAVVRAFGQTLQDSS